MIMKLSSSKNKKANYDSYKERQIEYEKHRVRSFLQPWSNAFPWVRHTMMMARTKKIMYCEVGQFFFGPLDLGSGPPEF